jgi:hypothetical protein
MKRVIIGIIAGGLILFAIPYIFVPSNLRQSTYIIVRTTQAAVQRYLLDENKWAAWWPVDRVAGAGRTAGVFTYGDYSFSVNNKFLSGIEVTTSHSADSTSSLISFIPIGRDSVKFIWEQQLETSLNPFTRIAQKRKAGKLKEKVDSIFQHLAAFLGEEKNIYGITIQHAIVTDTLLVTTRMVLDTQPDQGTIYRLIDTLQQYISKEGAIATNPPMLHTRKKDSSSVEVMVALPVNKVLKDGGSIYFKRMVRGNILVTEVQGGPGIVQHAFRQLENYLQDYHYESPAIPFESLVTDRLQQPDTSKWVTRIYYPVF